MMDTRQGGKKIVVKKALQPELGMTHGGISSLVLWPTPLGGMYFRIGCFDVIGDEDQKLGNECGNGEPYRQLFLPVAQEILILE
jgi:hypothetical protein